MLKELGEKYVDNAFFPNLEEAEKEFPQNSRKTIGVYDKSEEDSEDMDTEYTEEEIQALWKPFFSQVKANNKKKIQLLKQFTLDQYIPDMIDEHTTIADLNIPKGIPRGIGINLRKFVWKYQQEKFVKG
jgi:hypothetical protein